MQYDDSMHSRNVVSKLNGVEMPRWSLSAFHGRSGRRRQFLLVADQQTLEVRSSKSEADVPRVSVGSWNTRGCSFWQDITREWNPVHNTDKTTNYKMTQHIASCI